MVAAAAAGNGRRQAALGLAGGALALVQAAPASAGLFADNDSQESEYQKETTEMIKCATAPPPPPPPPLSLPPFHVGPFAAQPP